VHLAAAGLAGGKVDGVAEALEDADDGLAGLGKQRVVIAGDEERDAQRDRAQHLSTGMRALGTESFYWRDLSLDRRVRSATNFIPFRGIKRWSWEVYWLIQGFAAWIVAPLVLAGLLVPHLASILRGAPHSTMGYALLCGALWGVGGLTFGLAIRYLGIALGYAIALGLCTAFGTLIPPIYDGSIHAIVHETSGRLFLRAFCFA
jgi:hypothetical protein